MILQFLMIKKYDMKNITKKGIDKDIITLSELAHKYSNAIYEPQEGQKAHYDNQTKLVRIAMIDLRTGLHLAKEALNILSENDILED